MFTTVANIIYACISLMDKCAKHQEITTRKAGRVKTKLKHVIQEMADIEKENK